MEKKCFICENQSNQKTIDAGNVISVSCLSPKCGNYEISLRAIKYLDSHLYARENCQTFINDCKFHKRVADIYFKGNELTIGIVGQR